MGLNRPYAADALPRELPVFPLSGCLLLPRCELPLNIFEPRYIDMIDAALAGDRMVGMAQPTTEGSADAPEIYATGCAGRLTRFAETGDGRYLITLQGICRFRVLRETTRQTGFRTFAVAFDEFAGDLVENDSDRSVDRDAVLGALRAYSERNRIKIDWSGIADVSDELLVNTLAMLSPFGSAEKQALLEARDVSERGRLLVAMTEIELAGREAGRSLQ